MLTAKMTRRAIIATLIFTLVACYVLLGMSAAKAENAKTKTETSVAAHAPVHKDTVSEKQEIAQDVAQEVALMDAVLTAEEVPTIAYSQFDLMGILPFIIILVLMEVTAIMLVVSLKEIREYDDTVY